MKRHIGEKEENKMNKKSRIVKSAMLSLFLMSVLSIVSNAHAATVESPDVQPGGQIEPVEPGEWPIFKYVGWVESFELVTKNGKTYYLLELDTDGDGDVDSRIKLNPDSIGHIEMQLLEEAAMANLKVEVKIQWNVNANMWDLVSVKHLE